MPIPQTKLFLSQALATGGAVRLTPVAPGDFALTVTGAPADWRVQGVQARGRFGATVVVTDLDGDGAEDLAIGAPGHNPTGEDAAVASGAVFGFRGPLAPGERVANQAEVRIAAPRQYLETGRRFVAWSPRREGPSRLVIATRAATRE